MLALAIFGIHVSKGLGYLLPALIGLESMGIPSPGETALILSAVLASQGKLSIVLVIVIAVASAIIGDNIGYFIGRKLGREVLEADGPFRERRVKLIAAGDRFFERHGSKAVFWGRWIALLRVAAAWMAGINKMEFKQFFFWNALGGLTWATTVALVAYALGDAAAKAINTVGVFAAIGLGVMIVAAFVYIKIRERRAEHELTAPKE
jgi:membrane protein DedA with SNARE-associated domain